MTTAPAPARSPGPAGPRPPGGASAGTPGRRSTTLGVALVTLGVTFAALTAVEVILLVGSFVEPTWVILLFPAAGVLAAAAALIAWWRRPGNTFGAVLYALGLLWLAAGLVNVDQEVLIAIGFVLAVAPIAAVLHLLLAFPSGRLGGPLPRILVVAMYVVTVVLQAPRYVFIDAPDPYDLMAVGARPDLVDATEIVQNTLGAIIIVATAAVVAGRMRRADAHQRRTLGALGAYGILSILFVPFSAHVLVHWPGLDPVELAVAQVTVLGLVPIAFLAGLMWGGFARTRGLDELGAWLGAGDDAPGRSLREGLAAALGDPSVELLLPSAGAAGWIDESGAPAAPPGPGAGRGLVPVDLGGRTVAAIAYDATLHPDPEPVVASGRVLAIALDRERLAAELRASQAALSDSRARIVASGDRERRRVERNLHDGAQQRLTGLALLLRLAADRSSDRPEVEELIGEAQRELADALAELRELARGLHPAILTDVGLGGALESLSERSPVPVALGACPAERLPEEVEVAAYYVVAEALSNAAKHAGATVVTIDAERWEDVLRVRVGDDGAGGAVAEPGSGLEGLRDRVEAIGGTLVVDSPPGAGTRLEAHIPCG